MKTIQDIFDMLDLFYANIHLYQKIIRSKERYEKNIGNKSFRWREKPERSHKTD